MHDMEDNIRDLQERITHLEVQVEQLVNNIQDLITAWNTAQGLASFVKWTAGMITAVGVIYALFIKGKL